MKLLALQNGQLREVDVSTGEGGTPLPTPTVGQMLYCATAGEWTALPVGEPGKVLTLTGTTVPVPRWVTPSTGGLDSLTYLPGPLTIGGSGLYPYVDNTSPTGLFAKLGIAAGGGTWVNPHTAGAVTVVFSSGWLNPVLSYLVARSTAGYPCGVGTASWVGVDIGAGRTIKPRAYLLQGGPYAGRVVCDFVFEGSNDVGANTIAGFEAATWTVMDIRISDTTLSRTVINAVASFSCTPPATAYRWFRWRQTGPDAYPSSDNAYFPLTEIELYDAILIAQPPAPAIGWASDSAGHYLPYFAE